MAQIEEVATETPEVKDFPGIGAILDGVTWVFDPAVLTMADLEEIEVFTGRTEVQVLTDIGERPGRIALRNFLFAASRSMPGVEPLSLEEAFAKATHSAMSGGKHLSGEELAAAHKAAYPQR